MYASKKKLLLEALRSGEFKQTTGALKRDDCFCVEGLACELHRRATNGEWQPIIVDRQGRQIYGYFGEVAAPKSVHNWFGRLPATLMTRNDVDKQTFAQIADWIAAECPEEPDPA